MSIFSFGIIISRQTKQTLNKYSLEREIFEYKLCLAWMFHYLTKINRQIKPLLIITIIIFADDNDSKCLYVDNAFFWRRVNDKIYLHCCL